jgi:hypothetical protein
MDPGGRDLTNIGRTLGKVSTLLLAAAIVVIIGSLLAAGVVGLGLWNVCLIALACVLIFVELE